MTIWQSSSLEHALDCCFPPGPWQIILWNDPVNQPAYITRVLADHFTLSASQAYAIVNTVKAKGQAVIMQGQRERVEADLYALHSYGLRVTLCASKGATA